MSSNVTLFLIASLLTSTAAAVKFEGPQPTDHIANGQSKIELSPMPTAEPLYSGLRVRDLSRRQRLPADTCGYIEGDESAPFTCSISSACAFNTYSSYFGCCMTSAGGDYVTSDCPQIATAFTSCVDYVSAYQCVGDCYSSNRVCSSTAPYCAVAYLSMGLNTYSEYFCQTISGNFPTILIETTPTATSVTTPNPTSTPPHITAPSPPGTSSSPVTGSTSPPGPTPKPKSHSNKGAIAGGVVGGLLGVGALASAVIFLLRKKKNDERKQATMEVSQM